MSSIDSAIEQGKRRRKLLVVTTSIGLLLVLGGYLAWLFVTQGYHIEVKPQQAAQSHKLSLTQGLGFVVGKTVYVIGSAAELKVSAEKYASKQVRLWQHSETNIEVELEPLPAQVLLTTEPELEDIRWEIDGKLQFKGAKLQTILAPGQYLITAKHPYFVDKVQAIQANMAEEITASWQLQPIQGQIQLNSTPVGATVSMDGEVLGSTPLTLPRIGGDYAVTLRLPGYQRLEDRIQVTASNPMPQRNYILTVEQARVDVSLQPAEGLLLLNGSPITKPTDGPIFVPANKLHTISYDKAGFIAQSQQLRLKPGQQQQLNFNLQAQTGQVKFQASEVAQLYINGQLQGRTPLTLALQTVPTKVTFKKQGYRTVTQSFIPSHSKPQLIQAKMLTEFDARRQQGQPLFVSTLGIEMALVSPRAFTMGSAPNEAYRHRNEVQRNVDFSRQLWLSKHEITEGQYAAFAQGKKVASQLPVSNVSWFDAVRFCNWLSTKEGLKPFYRLQGNKVIGVNQAARGYRLPTEAEWEFVARLNRRSALSKYIWGNQDRLKDKQGNFADQGLKGKQTFVLAGYSDGHVGKAPVGSFAAERGGFYDLDGNVREWTHDNYHIASNSHDQVWLNYLGAERGEGHVVKGASFKTGRLKNIRASVRSRETAADEDIGFRIARYHQ